MALVIGSTAVLGSAPAGAQSGDGSAPRSLRCRQSVRSEQMVVEVEGVGTRQACALVRSLVPLIEPSLGATRRLYSCAAETHHGRGKATLLVHRFDGWRLRIEAQTSLRLRRGSASFVVTGTNFPIYCP